MTQRRTRGLAALCGIAFAYQMFATPGAAAAGAPDALTLLNSTSCGSTVAQLETPQPAQTPGNSPSPSPTPTLAPIPQAPNGPVQIYVTPVPSATPVTPPPVPTPTPSATPGGPVFVIRPTGPPPTIAPVSPGPITPRPSPTATPTGIPTLPPGYIAVLADQVVGNTHEGEPGDAIGNVNIFYGDEILVGERAHYDGVRTFTVVGNPYIINRAKDSILHADVIYFDTVTHVATLKHGEGESTENVERGKVYFSAQSLTSTEGGVAHGERAFVTTCEHPHGGYHLTGRTIDVTPGDKLTITKAVLFLGGLAIMYIPKVVIPLRQEDEQHRVSFFPQLGYDQAEGAWIKMKLAFGHDQYYNGYYTVNYFTKVGLGLGYTSFFNTKNGRRSGNIYFYEIHDRRTGTFSANGTVAETENFSRTLRNQFNFNYNGNYGPFTFIPSNTVIADTLSHTSVRSSQTYTYNRSATGTQSDVQSYGFTDHHQFTDHLSNDLALSYGNSQSNFAGVFQSLTNSTVNDLVHFITPGTDFQLNYLQNNYQTPSGVNKIPELAIRPNTLFSHFRFFPIAAQFYIGQYSERQTGFETSREDLSFQFGPALLHMLYSDFSLQVAVDQYIYGTGDLKARVTQNASMNTRITKHIVNTVTYNELNQNGPALVPFSTFDVFGGTNSHSAADVLRFFNGDVYNLSVTMGTLFNRMAQPVGYQLTARPSRRSIVQIGGAYTPGVGNGFYTTNLQFGTPFGRDADLQMVTDIDWKAKGRLENKNIYYHKIIGGCYEIRLQYNENLKQFTFGFDLLAFPSHGVNFGLNNNGPILPGNINF